MIVKCLHEVLKKELSLIVDPTCSPVPLSRSPYPHNLCPCLNTVHLIKYHSVSFSDVSVGELCTPCPTLWHVNTKLSVTNPDLITYNPGTKPSPSSVRSYICQYHRRSFLPLSVVTFGCLIQSIHLNRFKKEEPSERRIMTSVGLVYLILWLVLTHKPIKTSTLCLSRQLVPVVDSDVSRCMWEIISMMFSLFCKLLFLWIQLSVLLS